MLEFLPGWVKALIGSGMMLFIFVYGVMLTSKKDSNKGNKSNNTEK